MRVFVLMERHPSCGEDFAYVCKTRKEVEKKVTDIVEEDYEGERGVKKQLKECIKDIKTYSHGEVEDIHFDLYETCMEPQKVWLLKVFWHDVWCVPDVEFVCSSRERAARKAVKLARGKGCELKKSEFCNKDIVNVVDCKAARFEIRELEIDE